MTRPFLRISQFLPLGLLLLVLGLVIGLGGFPPKPEAESSQAPKNLGKALEKPLLQKQDPHPMRLVSIGEREFWQSSAPMGQAGGTLRTVSLGDGPKTFNLWASKDAGSSEVGNYLFVGLFDTDAYTGAVRPLLAKSVTVLPDKLTYEVTLRRGLRWSDGAPLTSRDVLFTWNVILKEGLGNPSMKGIIQGDLPHFPEVMALDAHRIRFKTAAPYAPFLRTLGVAIAPAHVLEPIYRKGGDAGFSAFFSTQQANRHPEQLVSNSGWTLKHYRPGQQVVFQKDVLTSHWVNLNQQPLPYLDQVTLRYVKDQNATQLLFEQGYIDVLSVSAQHVARTRLLKRPAFHLFDMGPAAGVTYMAFNLSSRKDAETQKPLVPSQVSGWFRQQAFRKALDWALNRSMMVETILQGMGAPLFTAEGPTSLFQNKALAQGHETSLVKARALLKQAGFHQKTPESPLRDAKGTPVAFTLLTNAENDQRVQTVQSIQQDLKPLGIEVRVKPIEFNTLVGRAMKGQWEAIVLGFTGGDSLEPNSGANVWKSDGPMHLFFKRQPGDKTPDRFSWETEIDTCYAEGARELDSLKRRQWYNNYQQIAYDQVPMIQLYSPRSLLAIQSRVQNIRPTPLAATHNLQEWWLSVPFHAPSYSP
jgi:peptide/nickel transport system substrate-binding protein